MWRRLGWVLAAGFAVVQAVWALRRPLPDRLADLHVYRGAVLAMWHGDSLYSYAAGNGDPFTYPPFAGLVLAPVGGPPEPLLRVLWTALTLAVVFALAVAVARRVPWAPAPLVALALLASAPVARDVRFGQVSVLLAGLVALDGLAAPAPATRGRGLATGLAGAIKLTPLVFVPYLWLAGRRRAAAYAVAAAAGATALAFVVLPGDSVRYWFTELWHPERIGNLAGTGNQSINGLLLRSGLPSAWVRPAWAVLAVVVLGLGLVRAARATRAGYPLVGLAVAGAVCVAVSPVSWTHHQIWLVLAAAGTVGRHRAVRAAWVATVLLIMTVPWLVDNLRGLLAVAVAMLVPFEEVRAEISTPAGTVPARS
jgi:alpha-1,2-mannosyltransferase